MANRHPEAIESAWKAVQVGVGLNNADLRDILTVAIKDAQTRDCNLQVEAFLAVMQALVQQGYKLFRAESTPLGENGQQLLQSDNTRSTKAEDDMDFEVVVSPNVRGDADQPSDDSDFEYDIDKEHQIVYSSILHEKQEKARRSRDEDSCLQKEIELANNHIRKLSYDDYIKQGNTFDHLQLEDPCSHFRVFFEDTGILDNSTTRDGIFYSRKTGPSSLIYVDSK